MVLDPNQIYFPPAVPVARVMLKAFDCVIAHDAVVCEQHHWSKHSHIVSTPCLNFFFYIHLLILTNEKYKTNYTNNNYLNLDFD